MTYTVASAVTEQAGPLIVAPSYAQERLWFMEQLVPGTAAYVLASTVRLRGPLDLDRLRQALDVVAARHDSLRTGLPSTPEGRPVLEIHPAVRVPWSVVDATDEQHAAAIIATAANTPFDLTVAPLVRGLLVRIGPDDHVFQVAAHHAVSDGWSMSLLLGQVRAAYAGTPLGPPPQRYHDYAAWQRQRVDATGGDDLAYWNGALAGVPSLELLADRPRPAEQRVNAEVHGFSIPAELTGALRRLARSHRATLFMTLLAGWQAVLFRYTGQRDFAVGSPVAGRPQPELEDVVGLFVNTLALRADLSLDQQAEPSFATVLRRTRTRVVRAMAHQEIPFERLVQELNVARDVSRTPLFQALFSLQNFTRSTTTWPDGLVEEAFSSGMRTSRFELSLYLNEIGDRLGGSLFYQTSVFDAATAERLSRHYVALLRAAVDRPDAPLTDLDLLAAHERAQVLRFGTPAPPAAEPTAEPMAATLGDLVTPYAQQTPRAPAVACGRAWLSYRELDRRANRLARWLRSRGVGPDSLVGVCLEQSVELAVALLGVLRAGGGYVPLDPEQPSARLGTMVADSGLALALTTTSLRHHLSAALPGPPAAPAELVCLDQIGREVAACSAAPVAPLAGPDHLAYVIFTSGSTGRPKGVAIAHRAVCAYLAGVAARFAVPPGARYALLQSMSFDFSVTTFYLALATGGCVHLVPRRCTGGELAGYLRRHQIDYLKMTPSHLAALAAETGAQALLPRRALILGGEPADRPWAAGLAAAGLAAGGTAVFNHYGPTEATVGATTYRVAPDATGPGMLPIGQPLPHTRVYVLDTAGRPAPVGVPGEIYLGGDRLAHGYLGQPALTAQRFVPDPYAGVAGARMYRTGDLGRWRPDGELEFLGRRDQQVKVRGYRVELGEVEAALRDLAGVVQAAVTLRGDRLVAYLEPGPGHPPAAPGELRALLVDRLPDYMIPGRFVWLDKLPRQDHGKVDRRALPDPPDDRPAGELEPPAGPVETAIADTWQRLLGVPRVGATDDFFDLGGHSLLATQVVAVLRRTLPDAPRPVTVMDLFQHRTVRELAAYVSGGAGTGAGTGALLHELTRGRAGPVQRTLVCVPYGGGSAVVYQPLADALPPGHRLLAVAMPGHDVGSADEPRPMAEVARAVADEILTTVEGRLAVYGHCGPGAAVAVEVTRLLEAAGREVDVLYLAAVFPFARPTSGLLGPLLRVRDRIRSDRIYRTWLQAQGTNIEALDPAEVAYIVRAMRHDARTAEDYFTDLLRRQVLPVRAPIVSVVGDRDRATDYYQERFREWHFLTDRVGLVVIDEGGHYFLKYRAQELAGIVATADHRLAPPAPDPPPGPAPSMGRFLAVALGQIVTTTGSALTGFALPLAVYLETGSLARFALFAILGILPGLVVAPVAGTVIDHSSRRRMLALANVASAVPLLAMTLLLFAGYVDTWHFYFLIAWLSVAAMWQRLSFLSAAPQLVPKRFLGHANGLVQMSTGVTQFLVPLAAVALLAAVGLRGILVINVVTYAVALAVLLVVRFPRTMALRRRESIAAELAGGVRFAYQRREFRAMLAFFAALNLFLFPMVYLFSPLVLSFGELADVATIAIAGGIGGAAGGLVMLVWGGPRQRMRGVLLGTFGIAAAAVVIGSRPDLLVIGAGAFALYGALAIVNGTYTTIVHTKVPQHYHGRVLALNQLVAFSTLPIGWGLLAPLLNRLAEPLLLPGGALAATVGAVIGVGPGRGTGLMYIGFGLAVALVVVACLSTRTLARFDREVPDAPPDDLAGLAAKQAREEAAP